VEEQYPRRDYYAHLVKVKPISNKCKSAFLFPSIYQAKEFSSKFETYSYLWLDDRDLYLQQFLNYGRQLTTEEIELLLLEDPSAPKVVHPTIELFKEQVISELLLSISFQYNETRVQLIDFSR